MGWYQRTERGRRGGQQPSRYRGSRKRIDRIRIGQHWSPEMVIFLLGLIVILLVAVPWLIKHPIN